MRILTIGLVCLTLFGCAGVQEKPQFVNPESAQYDAWLNHQRAIEQHKDAWQVSGRFGASMESDAWSGSIWWQQHSDDYAIQLAGPLNQGAIILTGNAKHAQLQLGEKTTHHDGDAEALLSRYTGWRIPFQGLRYWVLGLPQPMGEPQRVTLDVEGRISRIRHPYWNIEFKQYAMREGVSLPRKIILSNSEIKIRLVLDQWAFNG